MTLSLKPMMKLITLWVKLLYISIRRRKSGTYLKSLQQSKNLQIFQTNCSQTIDTEFTKTMHWRTCSELKTRRYLSTCSKEGFCQVEPTLMVWMPFILQWKWSDLIFWVSCYKEILISSSLTKWLWRAIWT